APARPEGSRRPVETGALQVRALRQGEILMAPPVNASALAKLPTWGKFAVGAALAVLTAGVYWFVFYSDTSAKIEGAERQKKGLRDDLAQEQQAEASYFADRDELALREQRSPACRPRPTRRASTSWGTPRSTRSGRPFTRRSR